MRAWTLSLVLAGALVACGDKDDDGDGDTSASPPGTDDTGAADDTGATDDTAAGDDSGTNPDAPTVTTADVWCYQHTTGDKFYQWVVAAEATDPQGLDTIESMVTDGITVLAGGTEVATYTMVCSDGQCSTSFSESEDSIACGNADTYTFDIRVVDEDENWSPPYEVMGRQGTDAAGR